MVTNSGDDITVSAEQLTALVARLLVAAGIPQSSAQTVAGALVDADLEGQSSHGVMLMDMYLDRIRHGSVSNEATGKIVSDKDGAVVLDAGHALGHLVGDQAIGIAVERARRFAVGVVAVRHGFHFGTARRFALQAAAADCIGIVMCNTRPLMPAPGGAERLVGNNPIAIAIPTEGPVPLVLDMATSAVAMGKIRMAAKSGQTIPANWAVKADGSETIDPAAAIAGMLLPSGGPKGFGLAFMIDLMCGLLSGGASGAAVRPLYGDPAAPYDSSQLFIAIDTAHFGDPVATRKAAAAAAERIRAGKTASGTERLCAPGEPEWRQRERSAGQVGLTPAVADMLVRMASEFGVSAAPLVSDEKRSEKDIRHAEA
jgi:LDH2 family malate/lactate/ureidoglycolate dehydrogenase